jgi:hypothetical protein
MERNYLIHLSMGEQTYWPSYRNKLPDLVDFCVTKGILQDLAVAKSCCDLSSDHSPVLITLKVHALNQEKQPSLSNRHTNLDDFRLTLNVTLKTEEILKQQSSSSTIQSNGQVGMQCQIIQTHSRQMTILY